MSGAVCNISYERSILKTMESLTTLLEVPVFN